MSFQKANTRLRGVVPLRVTIDASRPQASSCIISFLHPFLDESLYGLNSWLLPHHLRLINLTDIQALRVGSGNRYANDRHQAGRGPTSSKSGSIGISSFAAIIAIPRWLFFLEIFLMLKSCTARVESKNTGVSTRNVEDLACVRILDFSLHALPKSVIESRVGEHPAIFAIMLECKFESPFVSGFGSWKQSVEQY